MFRLIEPRPGARELVDHAPHVPLKEILRRFWPYARPFRGWLVVNVLVIVLVPAIEAAQIWMYKLLIDDVLVPQRFSPFVWIAAAYLGLTVLSGLVSFADDYLSTWIGEGFLRTLRLNLFRHVQELSLDFFERHRLGDVLSRLTGDVSSIETFVLSGLAQSLAYAVQIAIFTGLLFYLRWELALIALAVAPLAWLATRYFTTRIKAASREKRRRGGTLSAVAEESLANVQLVQAYNRQETEVERFDRENLASYAAELATTRVKALFSPAVDILKLGGGLAVIAAGTWQLQQGRLTLGGFLVFTTYLGSLYSPIRGLSRTGTSIFAATAGAERVLALLDEQPSVTERPRAKALGRVRGAVEFEHVSFRYAGRDKNALSDVCFRLEPGETVALVGQSGAGKSTIAKLLLRFYDPTEGAVRLDGIDLTDLRLTSLRSKIALLIQETLVFEGTVYENIAYGRPGAGARAIVEAAKAADAHDFIRSLPDGYDTMIGERGRRLSGGQRQRIAIARAMVRKAPLLILDEPTTGLDAGSAANILGPLQRLMHDRTTIVITHNLLLVDSATSVLVLDDGRVAEQGTPVELLARGGSYAQLHRAHRPDLRAPLTLVEPR
jgi:ABC-type multidrug transport system fused ATPase/permease subunit